MKKMNAISGRATKMLLGLAPLVILLAAVGVSSQGPGQVSPRGIVTPLPRATSHRHTSLVGIAVRCAPPNEPHGVSIARALRFFHTSKQTHTLPFSCFFFFFNDTATTEIYTLFIHSAVALSLGLWVMRLS